MNAPAMQEPSNPQTPIFDGFATDYERALAENLRYIPGGTDHYYSNRVRILAECLNELGNPQRILDFGSGVGLAIPFLREQFPDAEIVATDESRESLKVAKNRHPFIHLVDPAHLPEAYFDVVFVAGVLHHVPPPSRAAVLDQISNATKAGGLIIFFELNPLNPVTRRLVSMCPFDSDAILMKKSEVADLVASDSRLTIERSQYTVFFPPLFKLLHRYEKYLAWCPFGAQYYVALRRTSRVGK